jgi:sporadic carbohydrate cluster protein (TIGR04323 family)
MKRFRGYAFSRPFGDFVMPVPAQNSCMREFASRHEAGYVPPQLEHKFSNCAMQLYGSIAASERGDTVIMYSFEILYSLSSKATDVVLSAERAGVRLGFVLENAFVGSVSEFDSMATGRRLRDFLATKEYLVRLQCSSS